MILRSFATVRSSAILTSSYVGTDAVECTKSNSVEFFVGFTLGSLTSCECKVQYSDDATTWFDDSIVNTSGGTTSSNEFISPLRVNVVDLLATCSAVIQAPVLAKYARLMLKGTGTATSSLAVVYAYAGDVG